MATNSDISPEANAGRDAIAAALADAAVAAAQGAFASQSNAFGGYGTPGFSSFGNGFTAPAAPDQPSDAFGNFGGGRSGYGGAPIGTPSNSWGGWGPVASTWSGGLPDDNSLNPTDHWGGWEGSMVTLADNLTPDMWGGGSTFTPTSMPTPSMPEMPATPDEGWDTDEGDPIGYAPDGMTMAAALADPGFGFGGVDMTGDGGDGEGGGAGSDGSAGGDNSGGSSGVG